MITGLNHITLAVSDLSLSLKFYVDLLGFKPHARWDAGAYLSSGDLWLCLTLDKVYPSTDYSHIAFNVPSEAYAQVVNSLTEAGVQVWKQNKSEGNSLYFLDPDKHKLEVHDGDLSSRLQAVDLEPYSGWVRLD